MLNLLRDGLRETSDYRIYEKRSVLKLLLAFHDSPLSDTISRVGTISVTISVLYNVHIYFINLVIYFHLLYKNDKKGNYLKQ